MEKKELKTFGSVSSIDAHSCHFYSRRLNWAREIRQENINVYQLEEVKLSVMVINNLYL